MRLAQHYDKIIWKETQKYYEIHGIKSDKAIHRKCHIFAG